MKLVVLGSNGYRPNELGHTACYAIPELGIILDAGTGMCRLAHYMETDEFDIYLSHPHPDHTWGLTYLEYTFWRKMELDAAARGSKATLASVIRFLEEIPPMVRVHVAPEQLADVEHQTRRFRDHRFIAYVPLEGRDQLPGGGAVTAFQVHHREGESCYGFRLDWPGCSMAYVTDTYGEPGVSYLEHIMGVNVLLHECYMPDDDEPELARKIGHSHLMPVLRLAAEAEVGRLVLVHLSAVRPGALESRLDRAYTAFPRTEVAFDGMEIEF
jgi:ribonuclease BN (tRNA processing enzyme)